MLEAPDTHSAGEASKWQLQAFGTSSEGGGQHWLMWRAVR